jgi:H+/Cl- antiporter ClcA
VANVVPVLGTGRVTTRAAVPPTQNSERTMAASLNRRCTLLWKALLILAVVAVVVTSQSQEEEEVRTTGIQRAAGWISKASARVRFPTRTHLFLRVR